MRLERRFRRNSALEPGRPVAGFVIVLDRDRQSGIETRRSCHGEEPLNNLNDTNDEATLETVVPFGN